MLSVIINIAPTPLPQLHNKTPFWVGIFITQQTCLIIILGTTIIGTSISPLISEKDEIIFKYDSDD